MPDTPENKIARQLDSTDLVPAAPTFEPGPPQIVQPQVIGGPAWQDQKVIRDEQRLERVAKLAGAKAREYAARVVAAGSPAFGDARADADSEVTMGAPGQERRYRVVTTTDNPHAEADAKLLEEHRRQLEERGTSETFRATRDPGAAEAYQGPPLLTAAEKARRDELLAKEEQRCRHTDYYDTLRGMELVRVCKDCGLEATFGPDGVVYAQRR